MSSPLILQDTQQVLLSITPEDAAGNPAVLDEVPVWAVGGTNTNIVTLVPATNGLSCEVVAAGPLGTCQVQVTAAADATTGGVVVMGVLNVTVTASTVAAFSITAAAPVVIPTPSPSPSPSPGT